MNKWWLSALWCVQVCAAPVTLNDTVKENFGIAVTTVNGAKLSQQWMASVHVLDGAKLVSTTAELRAAQATSTASASELARVTALHAADNNVALKVLEQARAQASSDRAKVQALRAQLLSDWGTAITALTDAKLDALTQQLLAGGAMLARAESASHNLMRTQTVQLTLPDQSRLSAQLLGAMPQPSTTGRAYLLKLTTTADALQPGTALSVSLRDAAQTVAGISVPRAAVIRWQGKQWVYVQTAANQYQRRAIQITQWQDAAALVSGLSAGDQVVTSGAGLLLGAELSPAEAEEEAE